MKILASGPLAKMKSQLNSPVEYLLPVGEQDIPMNELIGSRLRLRYASQINCIYCDRETNKSFNQGYCYPCFKRLARCDSCIMSPEKCHFDQGTCREPDWAEDHCMVSHTIYLANSSGLKVGITRNSQIPTRWIDQGAIQALPIMQVDNRFHSGLVEDVFKAHVADKTNWRTMLKGQVQTLDMKAEAENLFEAVATELEALKSNFGADGFKRLDEEPLKLEYPVETFPEKVASFNLDKQEVVEGVLNGIKGQYLLLDGGVINIRKFTAYHIEFAVA